MSEKDRLRKKKIHIFLSEGELELAKEKAAYSRMSVSAFVRGLIVDGAIINYRPFEIEKLIYEMHKIGNNVNQIAKAVNTRGGVIEMDVDELRLQYEKLFEMYISAVLGG